jgi:hypothetical protein
MDLNALLFCARMMSEGWNLISLVVYPCIFISGIREMEKQIYFMSAFLYWSPGMEKRFYFLIHVCVVLVFWQRKK